MASKKFSMANWLECFGHHCPFLRFQNSSSISKAQKAQVIQAPKLSISQAYLSILALTVFLPKTQPQTNHENTSDTFQ